MSEETTPQISLQDALHAAIAHALKGVDGDDQTTLLSRWVLCVEQVHERGSSCSYIASESMSTWEVLGMTEAAGVMAREQLSYGLTIYDDDEDDDEDA